jgi:hypothetical protein
LPRCRSLRGTGNADRFRNHGCRSLERIGSRGHCVGGDTGAGRWRGRGWSRPR